MSKIRLVVPNALEDTGEIDHAFIAKAGIRVAVAHWGLFMQKSLWHILIKNNFRQIILHEDEGFDAMQAILLDLPECTLLSSPKSHPVAKLMLESAHHNVLLVRPAGTFMTRGM